jgi:hypothetical protein
MMKRGCTGTISKQKLNDRHDKKKHVRVDQMWRCCLVFYFYFFICYKRLREAERRKRPEGWRNKTWMLHHDNAPAHTLLLVWIFGEARDDCRPPTTLLSRFGSFGLFFLFPKLKSTLKGHRFQTIEEIEENSLWDLRAIPQNVFQDAFQNWKIRWMGCIDSGGEYFEGHKSYKL